MYASSGLDKVFYMLMISDVIALILLARLVIGDIKRLFAGHTTGHVTSRPGDIEA